MTKKSLVLIFCSFLLFLVVTIGYFHERKDRVAYKKEMIEWKKIAQTEMQMPSVNANAEKFVSSLHEGSHKKMLTGSALNKYKKALKESEDFSSEDDHIDESSDQNVVVLLSSTKSTGESSASSQVLYQLEYVGVFDNEEKGIVDKRILTFVMDIEWDKKDSSYLVSHYDLTLLEDNLGKNLKEEYKGSEEGG